MCGRDWVSGGQVVGDTVDEEIRKNISPQLTESAGLLAHAGVFALAPDVERKLGDAVVGGYRRGGRQVSAQPGHAVVGWSQVDTSLLYRGLMAGHNRLGMQPFAEATRSPVELRVGKGGRDF